MQRANFSPEAVTIRTNLEPGDFGAIVALHGTLYAGEYGFDATFEAYVAGPLADFVCRAADREQLWIAEHNGRVIGCIAIVAAGPGIAQLRWFLIAPSARGAGLGKRLLREAVTFSGECGYNSIILWTVSVLAAAAHLYRAAGFQKVEEHPDRKWGMDVIEEKYELRLR